MNRCAALRRQHGLTLENMARLLVIQPATLLRCEHGAFDHVPEIQDEFQRRLMALGWLDRAESIEAA